MSVLSLSLVLKPDSIFGGKKSLKEILKVDEESLHIFKVNVLGV